MFDRLRVGLRRGAKATGRGLTELLYPARCFGCGSRCDRPGLCHNCEGSLQAVTAPFCSVCGEPYQGEIVNEFVCANCTVADFSFKFAISGYRAAGPMRQMIHDFKYHRRLAARRTLAELAEIAFEDPRMAALTDPVIVPVPLHPRRKRERGYNQAAEVAGLLARARGLAYRDALLRPRYTSAQARLVREERLANLRRAFELRPATATRERIDGAQVILFDDVFTTGATADACARVLLEHGGAEKVVVATVARG